MIKEVYMADKEKDIEQFPKWKLESKEYLRELEKFLDMADNIESTDLKNDIISQMLKCDKILTKIAQEKINKESIK